YSATHETPAHQTSRAPYTTLFRSHMLTREALAEFAEHLAPGGVLAVHVSNRNLELAPMVGATSAEAGVEVVVRYDPNTDTDGGAANPLATSPEVFAFSPDAPALEPAHRTGAAT